MEKLRLTLFVRRSLLVGGQTSALLADTATAREAGGAPIIPASAVKGALRIEFERFLAGLGQRVCHLSRPDDACKPLAKCLACQLFGAPGKEGKLRFSDAFLQGEWRRWFTNEERPQIEPKKPTGQGYTIRPGVAINRIRKVAEEQMLFSSEIVAPLPNPTDKDTAPLVFAADIEAMEPLKREEFEFLQAAAQSLTAIGADKSRGLGHLQAQLERVETSSADREEQPSSQETDMHVLLVPIEYVRVSGIKTTNNFLESLEFLPGGAIRGAVAKSFAKARGSWQDDEVREAFLRNPVSFENFYPSTVETNVPPKPIPLSARTCKAYPGFQQSAKTAEQRESHGAKDILIAATVVKLLREQGIFAVFEDRCKLCDAVFKGLDGFYLSPGQDASKEVSRRTTTKTAINRSRFTSAEEQLYSYEALDVKLEYPESPGAKEKKRRLRFIGAIRGLTDELYAHLLQAKALLIGGARSRGFGKVKIEKLEAIPLIIGRDSNTTVFFTTHPIRGMETQEGLRKRLRKFTEAIQTPLRAAKHPKCDSLFFALTCTSDLMLPPSRDFDWLKGTVETVLGLSGRNLQLEKVTAKTDYRGGFNDALGIQKDLNNVIVRGSAFVFSCDADEGNTEAVILKQLPALLQSGLGRKREEGFGRISFCDAFHLDRMQQS